MSGGRDLVRHPSKRAQATLTARKLSDLYTQRFDLDLLQATNDSADEDPVPGVALGANGEVETFKKRRQRIDDALARLEERFPEAVKAALEMLEEQEDS